MYRECPACRSRGSVWAPPRGHRPDDPRAGGQPDSRQTESEQLGVATQAPTIRTGIRCSNRSRRPTWVTLQAKWAYHLVGQQHVQAVPVVADGVMYISQYNRVDAVDARSGSIIWQYQTGQVSTATQRGTAVYGNKVFVTTTDSRLVALDARTGATIWDSPIAGERYRFAGQAPLVAKGKVIMSGNQPFGFIQAYDAETGKHAWTWNAIPQSPKDPGAETWAGDSWKLGGGPIWVSGSFDPELNTIFYGTGQPGSQWAGDVREGDNLFTECVVALDVDTGKMKWYFQATPHDVRDWDSLEMPVLDRSRVSADSRASCWCRRIAMGTTTCSIARMDDSCKGRRSSAGSTGRAV